MNTLSIPEAQGNFAEYGWVCSVEGLIPSLEIRGFREPIDSKYGWGGKAKLIPKGTFLHKAANRDDLGETLMSKYFTLVQKILDWAREEEELVYTKGSYFMIPRYTHEASEKGPTPRSVKDRYLAIVALTGLSLSLDGGDGTLSPEEFPHTADLKAGFVLLLQKNHRYHIPMWTGHWAAKWFEMEMFREQDT